MFIVTTFCLVGRFSGDACDEMSGGCEPCGSNFICLGGNAQPIGEWERSCFCPRCILCLKIPICTGLPPTITTVRGCPNATNNGTFECPTLGGNITVTGTNFAADTRIYIDNQVCTIVTLSLGLNQTSFYVHLSIPLALARRCFRAFGCLRWDNRLPFLVWMCRP